VAVLESPRREQVEEAFVARASRRRYRRLDDEFLARVAGIYGEAVEAGEPPTQAVADRADVVVVSYDTAKRWVAKAAERGYLPKGRQGRKRITR